MTKRYAVFGGSQGVGKEFIMQALEQGSFIKALARTPEKLQSLQEKYPNNIEIIKGDVFDKESVLKTIDNQQDGVLISLGTRPFSKHDPAVCSKGTVEIIDAMNQKNIKRVVCISSFAVGDSWNDSGFIAKGFFWLFLGRVLADKEIQENYLKQSNLDWTILRPGGLSNGPLTGKYRVDEHIRGGQVSRANVAQVALKEFQENKWLKRTPTVLV